MKGIIVTVAIALAAAIGGGAEAQERPMPAECLNIEKDGWPARQRQRKNFCARIPRMRELAKQEGCDELDTQWENLLREVIENTTRVGEEPNTEAGKAALRWLEKKAPKEVDRMTFRKDLCAKLERIRGAKGR